MHVVPDIFTGNRILLWQYSDKPTSDLRITGDLVFAISDESKLVAFEKYNIEQLPGAAQPIHYTISIQSSGDSMFLLVASIKGNYIAMSGKKYATPPINNKIFSSGKYSDAYH